MSRLFLGTIKNTIESEMADNDTGDFLLEADRSIRVNEIDSLYEKSAIIYSGTLMPGPANITTSFARLDGSFYTEQKGDDSAGEGFVRTDLNNGVIFSHPTYRGMVYKAYGIVSFRAEVNAQYEMCVTVDQVPTAHVARVSGLPGADEMTVPFTAYELDTTPGALWAVEVRSPDAPVVMTDVRVYFMLTVMPTNAPLVGPIP